MARQPAQGNPSHPVIRLSDEKRMETTLTRQFTSARRELTTYLCRLVIRPQVAEDLVQTTYLRCLENSQSLPDSNEGVRAWLFKVASNLAFDELRRHANWRETALQELRDKASADAEFVHLSRSMKSTPETKAIAREHLVACLACTLRNLPERRAAALLLKEVHGFTLTDTAALLDATTAQVKNWLQEARSYMDTKYGTTCALITKEGVCHQCVELDGYFGAHQGAPLTADCSIDARLRIATLHKDDAWSPWHRKMFELLDELN